MIDLFNEESYGKHGKYSIKIQIEVPGGEKTIKDPIAKDAMYRAVEILMSGMMEASIKHNKIAQKYAKKEKEQILSIFPDSIYVEEIPNGYCNNWCCKHLPWFIVTTKVGCIKIGWRRSVIEIDWEKSNQRIVAKDLFPKENVTKNDKYIHAHSIEDAAKYIKTILETKNEKC